MMIETLKNSMHRPSEEKKEIDCIRRDTDNTEILANFEQSLKLCQDPSQVLLEQYTVNEQQRMIPEVQNEEYMQGSRTHQLKWLTGSSDEEHKILCPSMEMRRFTANKTTFNRYAYFPVEEINSPDCFLLLSYQLNCKKEGSSSHYTVQNCGFSPTKKLGESDKKHLRMPNIYPQLLDKQEKPEGWLGSGS